MINSPSNAKPFSPVALPSSWTHTPSIKTRSELIQRRRQEFIPDITYDIDGDGFVDHKDMAIAKMFDKNKDGILDDEEKAEMMKALNNGMMDKYVWGLEQTGSNKHPRLIQKNGNIITDSAQPAARTAEPKTFRALKEKEKLENQLRAENIINTWIESHPNHIVITQEAKPSQSKFKSWTEKRAKERLEARGKIGLVPETDTKEANEVKFLYKTQPKISSFSEFKTKRKQKMLDELHNTKNYEHVSREHNFNIRENGYIHIIPESSNYMTQNKLAEKRKQEINEYNLKTFSNPSIGIHGSELPKYRENCKEFWKNRENWVNEPASRTRTALLTTRDFKKKFEIAEKIGSEDIEIQLKKSQSKHEICIKPNHRQSGLEYKPIYNDEFEGTMGSKHDYRLSTIFGYFLKSKSSSHLATAEPATTSRREVKRETFQNNNQVIEAISPKTITGFAIKTKSLIKKQGTSQRLLRSRGFIG